MKELPDDLATMPSAELSRQRALRDDRITRLFRRWPKLSRFELRQLRRLHAERLEIAKHVGRLRTRRRSA